MLENDLSSDTVQKVHRELDCLNLATLPDLKDEFLQNCEQFGVG